MGDNLSTSWVEIVDEVDRFTRYRPKSSECRSVHMLKEFRVDDCAKGIESEDCKLAWRWQEDEVEVHKSAWCWQEVGAFEVLHSWH